MRPRLISQVIELLPHATRLVPIADNYLSVRREGAKARRPGAIAEMAENLRVDVGRVRRTPIMGWRARSRNRRQQIAALQDAIEVAQTQSFTQNQAVRVDHD